MKGVKDLLIQQLVLFLLNKLDVGYFERVTTCFQLLVLLVFDSRLINLPKFFSPMTRIHFLVKSFGVRHNVVPSGDEYGVAGGVLTPQSGCTTYVY